jgi:hypothetical protein
MQIFDYLRSLDECYVPQKCRYKTPPSQTSKTHPKLEPEDMKHTYKSWAEFVLEDIVLLQVFCFFSDQLIIFQSCWDNVVLYPNFYAREILSGKETLCLKVPSRDTRWYIDGSNNTATMNDHDWGGRNSETLISFAWTTEFGRTSRYQWPIGTRRIEHYAETHWSEVYLRGLWGRLKREKLRYGSIWMRELMNLKVRIGKVGVLCADWRGILWRDTIKMEGLECGEDIFASTRKDSSSLAWAWGMSSWLSPVLIAHSGYSSAWEAWLEVKASHDSRIYMHVCGVFTQDIMGSQWKSGKLGLIGRAENKIVDPLLPKASWVFYSVMMSQSRRDMEDSNSVRS